MNKLFIDTTNTNEAKVSLQIREQKFEKKSASTILRSQSVLPLIDELLKEHGLVMSDINEVFVNVGPGSYTGIKVGIAIANAIGYALKIPINNQLIGKFVEAKYE